ncbi:hypothetical protein ACFFJN_06145 [Erwinia mallotivora]|uniref:hypothetical protein n=1 Tax=Erwinia mallotivora TaxID=69222 RepID=UPI0035EA8675
MCDLPLDNPALETAASRAHQAEIVLRLMSQYPSNLANTETEALIGLLLPLVGSAASYLITEQGKQEEALALPPAPGDLYIQNDSGMQVVVRQCADRLVVFSYIQYPDASHDYPPEAFRRDFTRQKASHA